MYYVYAISSTTRKYIYIGLTSDITDRLERHNARRERTTKAYAPYNLIFLTTCEDRITARLIEKYFKSGIGKEFLTNRM